jgi:DNA polymerase-1
MEFPRLDNAFCHQLGLDYETDRLEYWHPGFKVLGVGIATRDQSWYFHADTPNLGAWLRDTLPDHQIAAHNAQFDLQCTRTFGIDPRAIDWHCTMVSDCLIDEHQLTYDLTSVARRNGIDSQKTFWLDQIAAALGAATHRDALARLRDAPPDLVAGYGASDASDTLAIMLRQLAILGQDDLLEVYRLEMDLLPVLADMSWYGVKVDLEAAWASIPKMDIQSEQLQKEVDEIAGKKFNVNSTPQIRDIFKPEAVNKFQFRLVDGTIVGSTKGGKGPSIDQVALRSMQHPLAAKILALRKTIKLRDTFIKGHVIGSADANGYVHTNFNQTRNDADAGTVTGRLSSTDPALQQITKRDKENAAILRSMFIPDEGQEWLCQDYSQVDFRCGAHLINDPKIIKAYWDNPDLDYHQIVSDMTGIPRNAPYAGAPYAKQMNLGMQFGAGPGKVCFMMKMPYEVVERKGKMVYLPGEEGKRVFELYHSKLPGVKGFSKHAEAVAKETGFVKTQIGRRLRFPGRRDCHKAAGLLFQAYAADLHKFGLVRTDNIIRQRKLDARLMLSVHDEMGLSSIPDPQISEQIARVYTDFNSDDAPVKMRVPITASCRFGKNWWIACKD